MRRTAVMLIGAVLAVVGVVTIQRLNQDRLYRSLLASGDAAMADGSSYLAVEAFSGALAVRGDSMVAHYRRGEAYAALGQARQAERDLRQALRLAPDAPEPLEALGRLHDRRGEHAAAADWYTAAAERLHDSDARLLYALALARYRTGALPAAQNAARRAVARDDGLAEAHYLLGLVEHDLQNRREATAALEHAVRLRPSFVAARQELAALYREQGQHSQALEQLQTLVNLDAVVDRRLALSRALLESGDETAALAALTPAASATPEDARVSLAIGRIHLARAELTGDPAAVAEALSVLEHALAGTARRSEGLALYGHALHLSGDAEAAERLLLEATHTSPVDQSAFGYLADVSEQLGHHLIARDALLDLDALQGNTLTSDERRTRARRLGILSLEGEDAAAAVEHLTLASTQGDRTAATLGLLARALWLDGQLDAARATLADALALADAPDLRRLERSFR